MKRSFYFKSPIILATVVFALSSLFSLTIYSQETGETETKSDTTQVKEGKKDKKKDKKEEFKVREGKAEEKFNTGNFQGALEDYLLLLADDPGNVEYNHHVGMCYLELNRDKTKAISYLEYVTQQSKFDRNAWYDLGRAYMYALRFDDAIKAFNNFKEIPGRDINYIPADRQLEICVTAKELVKYPVDVTFENLGIRVNTEYPEFNPFVPADESFLVYNSKRPDNLGLEYDYDGYRTSDIYRARERRGHWTQGRNIGTSINTEWVEHVVGLTADGEYMFVHIDNFDGFDDIYVSRRKGRGFEEASTMGRTINSVEAEIAGFLSPDHRTFYFAREDDDINIGGTDLYYANVLPNGRFGTPRNLGDLINTKYNETMPVLSQDGKTLYFASEGHTSMGGFDVFKCEWNEVTETWGEPQNLGFPVNTVYDNTSISMAQNGRYGYVAAFRQGGYGDLDLYRITFNEIDPPYTVVRGLLTNIADSLKIEGAYMPQASLEIRDNITDELIGIYKPNSRSGNYISILEPGSYCFYWDSKLYKPETAVIEVMGKSSYEPFIDKDFTLEPDSAAIERWLKEQKPKEELLASKDDGTDLAVSGKNEDLLSEIEKLEQELELLKKTKELGYNQDLLAFDETTGKGPEKLKVGDKIILDKLYFDFNSAQLRDVSKEELDKLYAFMNNNPKISIEISGHTDAIGSDEYNMKLSKERAEAVADYLKMRGIRSRRIKARGYGKTKPIANNVNPDGTDNPQGRQLNRRIELEILKK